MNSIVAYLRTKWRRWVKLIIQDAFEDLPKAADEDKQDA